MPPRQILVACSPATLGPRLDSVASQPRRRSPWPHLVRSPPSRVREFFPRGKSTGTTACAQVVAFARIYIVSLRRKARGCHGSPTEHVLGGVRAHHAPLGSAWARTQPSRARRGHGHEAAVAPRSAALSREKADQRCAADGAERVTQAVARTVSGAYSPHAMSCDRCCARSEAARRRPL